MAVHQIYLGQDIRSHIVDGAGNLAFPVKIRGGPARIIIIADRIQIRTAQYPGTFLPNHDDTVVTDLIGCIIGHKRRGQDRVHIFHRDISVQIFIFPQQLRKFLVFLSPGRNQIQADRGMVGSYQFPGLGGNAVKPGRGCVIPGVPGRQLM